MLGAVFFLELGIVLCPSLYGQTGLTPGQVAAAATAVSQTEPIPAPNVPPVGVFFLASDLTQPGIPVNLGALPAWDLGSNIFILDDIDAPAQFDGRTKDDGDGPPSPGDGGTGGDGSTNSPSPFYSFDTNALYLTINGITNGFAYLNLYNATDYVYEVMSTPSFTPGLDWSNPANWTAEQAVFPSTNQNPTPFTVQIGDRTNNLFFWARDWTGVTENGNTTPDWWFFYYFGTTALSDANVDSVDNTLLSDFQNGADPNIIYFAVNVTNHAFNTSSAMVQITVSGGVPYYMATLPDSADPSSANWTAYNSNPVVNLGSVPGWHTVWIGLKGLPANAQQTWQQIQLKLVPTPPLLIVTNPAPGVVTQPFIQVQGYSPEDLVCVTYDLSNSVSFVTNQDAFVTGWQFDLADLDYTTNSFQCFNVPLANGANSITLHATDDAGNVATTNLVYILDPTANTNPPVMSVSWPQNNAVISGTNFPVRGTVNDPFSTLTAQIIDGTNINTVTGLVEWNGSFWIEKVPLGAGTNYLTITATNTAGYGSATSLAIIQSSVTLTIGSVSFNDPISPTATVTGTLAGSSDSVYVNGVLATNNGNVTWTAYYVPVGDSGTAAITAEAMVSGGSGTPDAQVARDIIRGPEIALVNCDWNAFEQFQWIHYNVASYLPWYAVYDISYNETDNAPMHWSYGSSGYNLYSDCAKTIGNVLADFDPLLSYTNTGYNYALTSWDTTGNGSCFSIEGDDCGATNGTTSPGAPASTFLPWFAEEADWQVSIPSEGLTWQYLDKQRYVLKTRGQSVAGQQYLWVIHATANVETPGVIESPGAFIQPTQISVDGQPLDSLSNRVVYGPANVNIGVTPQTSPNPYTFGVGFGTASLLSLTVASNSATLVNSNNWAAVETTNNDYVYVQANLFTTGPASTANLPTDWLKGGAAVPGNPLQRRISKSAPTNVLVTASLGPTNLSVNVWVIWATISNQFSGMTPVNAQGLWTNPPIDLLQWCPGYDLGVQCYTNMPDHSGVWAWAKECTIVTVSPHGFNLVTTTNDWKIYQYYIAHEFIDRVPNTNNDITNLYFNNWSPDGSDSGPHPWRCTHIPDSNDMLYTIDAPNMGEHMWEATNSYEMHDDFQNYVAWKENLCSSTNNYWHFEAGMNETNTPMLNPLNLGGGLITNFPTTPEY